MMRKNNSKSYVRSLSFDALRADEDGTYTISVSSEKPYMRWYGNEILLHSADNVILDFINSGAAPLLHNHKRDVQIGVVERAYLDKKRLIARVRFSQNPLAQEVKKDVDDGIVKNVSIGYTINEYLETKGSQDVKVTSWEPKEVSFVSVPADTSVGIGRSERKMNMEDELLLPGLGKPAETDEKRAERIETTINEIAALAAEHNMADIARSYISGTMQRGDEPSLAIFKGIARSNLPENKPLRNENIGLSDTEKKRFSVLSVMRSLDGGSWKGAEFEKEACDAAEERSESARRGGSSVILPTDVMDSWGEFERDGVSYQQVRAALATSGNANILTTDHLAASFIDNLRNLSAVLRAGVTTLPGLSSNVEIPGGDQNIGAAWLASEGANAAESNPTFRKVELAPKDLAAYTDVTRRMLQQSTIAMEAYIRRQMVEAHRIAIDLAAVYGAGETGVPEGIANTSGIGSVTFAAAIPTRGEIIDLRTAIANTNRGSDITFLSNSAMVGNLQKTTVDAGSGQFLMGNDRNRLIGENFIESNQITAGDIIAGVFQDMMMGMWGGLEIDRSTEALFLSGGIRYRSIQTVDFALSRVGSFALGNDTA